MRPRITFHASFHRFFSFGRNTRKRSGPRSGGHLSCEAAHPPTALIYSSTSYFCLFFFFVPIDIPLRTPATFLLLLLFLLLWSRVVAYMPTTLSLSTCTLSLKPLPTKHFLIGFRTSDLGSREDRVLFPRDPWCQEPPYSHCALPQLSGPSIIYLFISKSFALSRDFWLSSFTDDWLRLMFVCVTRESKYGSAFVCLCFSMSCGTNND